MTTDQKYQSEYDRAHDGGRRRAKLEQRRCDSDPRVTRVNRKDWFEGDGDYSASSAPTAGDLDVLAPDLFAAPLLSEYTDRLPLDPLN